MDDIGKKMMERRKELGLTLEEVGKEVGVGKSTVRKWENGMIKNMGRDKISKLANVLQMNPIEFVPSGRVTVVDGKPSFAVKTLRVVSDQPLGINVPQVKKVTIDPELKTVLKLWKVSTPAAKKAAVQVLETLAKEEKP